MASVIGLGPVVAACGDPTIQASACDGYSALSATDLQRRQALGYVDVTPDPAQQCQGCRFYQPPAPSAACGGCQLFPGPVAPGGYCASWVAA